jgi:septal ring factor EnvC (AmiA/AmiB activator)
MSYSQEEADLEKANEQIYRKCDRLLTEKAETLALLREQETRITVLEGQRERLIGKIGAQLSEISELKEKCEEQDREIERLKQENVALNGDPDAVHVGAQAAISALHQCLEIAAERDSLRAQLAAAQPPGTLPGMRALLEGSRITECFLGPLYGMGWNGAIDHLLSKLEPNLPAESAEEPHE